MLIGMESGPEINSMLGTQLSQHGAAMRATMSFLFPKSNKLGVISIIS